MEIKEITNMHYLEFYQKLQSESRTSLRDSTGAKSMYIRVNYANLLHVLYIFKYKEAFHLD